ncbi:NAD(P)H-dependent oxidoreductase [Corynebacterium sp. A21]|uniref:NAD(P)H-dependent oxidoreductase n=1 Tax=Corynebacterium sp. A21 TaxID=3457318 RepID=UPI003FD0B692
MSRTLKIVTLNGSYSLPGKTGALLELIVEEVQQHHEVSVEEISVATLGPGFTGALGRDEVSVEVEAKLKLVEQADLLVVGTPVFRGSYTGLFKHFIDLLDQYALANKSVLLAATGGSDRHTLVIDQVLRPLFGFLQAAIAPVGLYASSGDFSGTLLLNPEVYARIEIAVRDLGPRLNFLASQPGLDGDSAA